MATRRDRYCSYCGRQLLAHPDANSVKCTCGFVTRLRPRIPIPRRNGVQQAAANLALGLLGRVTSALNTLNANQQPRPTMPNPDPPSVDTPKPDPQNPDQPNRSYNFGPPAPPQPLSPPPAHGRKRAVLCGVSYRGKQHMLKGSVNDVKNMRFFLTNRMGFPSGSILVLTEEELDPSRIPTKHNILMALRWLVHGVRAGDSLVFHFSGHGSKQMDMDMDELDGYDETICPVDHEISGKIVDDEINSIIVRPLPREARLHAIIDSCYSGTVLDLPFLCRIKKDGFYRWEDHQLPSAAYRGTNGGVAICISACDDHETSADTSAFLVDTVTGAMTFSFIQAMANYSSGHPTYGHLLNAMRTAIRQAKAGDGYREPAAGSMQEPQLSSSEKFEIYSAKIAL
ncbi:hypothetical protein CDL15_Pgr008149 [Punica granatum]|nr:hypothetical protein CDL15_Pgr008149 [Punica granatum]PKI48727.1 hypothetical protein CRG98_030868 [Punica granatum]